MTVKVSNPVSRSLDTFMKEIFNEFPSNVSKTVREDVLHFPPVNIVESANDYQVYLAVPGFEKSDFIVKLENNILTISTEKRVEPNTPDTKLLRHEFSFKPFKRSFTIDEKIDAEQIGAKYENGILKLELPKREIARAVAKEINIQ